MLNPPSRTFVKLPLWRLLLTAALLAAAPLALLAAPPRRPAGPAARRAADRRPSVRPLEAPRQGGAGERMGDLVLALSRRDADAQRVLPSLSLARARSPRSQHRRAVGRCSGAAGDAAVQLSRGAGERGRVNGFGDPIAVPITYVIDAQGVIRAQLQAEGPSGVSEQALQAAVLPLLATGAIG